MGYLILGIIILAAILIFGGYVVLSVMNAAMWMDDSMRWGGRQLRMTEKMQRVTMIRQLTMPLKILSRNRTKMMQDFISY